MVAAMIAATIADRSVFEGKFVARYSAARHARCTLAPSHRALLMFINTVKCSMVS